MAGSAGGGRIEKEFGRIESGYMVENVGCGCKYLGLGG